MCVLLPEMTNGRLALVVLALTSHSLTFSSDSAAVLGISLDARAFPHDCFSLQESIGSYSFNFLIWP